MAVSVSRKEASLPSRKLAEIIPQIFVACNYALVTFGISSGISVSINPKLRWNPVLERVRRCMDFIPSFLRIWSSVHLDSVAVLFYVINEHLFFCLHNASKRKIR